MTLTERAAILNLAAECGYRQHTNMDCTWIVPGGGQDDLIDEDELVELIKEAKP